MFGTMCLTASIQVVLGDSPVTPVVDQTACVSSSTQHSASFSGSVEDCVQICLVEHPGNQSYCRQMCSPPESSYYLTDPIQPITQAPFYSRDPINDCIQICLVEHPGNQTYCVHQCNPSPIIYTTGQVRSQSRCSQSPSCIPCCTTNRACEYPVATSNRRGKRCTIWR